MGKNAIKGTNNHIKKSEFKRMDNLKLLEI